jgi:2-methylcitrate dehydratase PrpD
MIQEEDINDPDILETAQKVSIGFDPESEKTYRGLDGGPRERRATVIIKTKEGEVFTKMVKSSRGGVGQELTSDEMRDKFIGLVEPVVGHSLTGIMLDRIEHLEELRDIKQLAEGFPLIMGNG